MKRFIVITAGSLALLAGNAFAGGGCLHGQKAAMADAHEATEEPIAEQGLSPELLARLKRQEKESLEPLLVVPPNIPN